MLLASVPVGATVRARLKPLSWIELTPLAAYRRLNKTWPEVTTPAEAVVVPTTLVVLMFEPTIWMVSMSSSSTPSAGVASVTTT